MTFDAILEATARILEEDGLSAVTTNSVAETAGVSIGSLYQCFPSKDAILAELIRRERETFKAQITVAASNPSNTLDDAVLQLLSAAVDHQLLRPKLAKSLEYAESLLALDEETEKLNEAIVNATSDVLRNYQFEPIEPTARDLVALVKGLIDSAGRDGESDRESLLIRARWAAMGYLSLVKP